MGFMETSALDSINVGNVFKELITGWLRVNKLFKISFFF